LAQGVVSKTWVELFVGNVRVPEASLKL